MIRQGAVGQLRSGELSRKNGYIAVTMRFYPRGLKKELMDEYRSDLAPDTALFKDFKKFQESNGHDQAFIDSHYEERFQLSSEGMYNLRQLAEKAKTKDVFFVCQCEVGARCHREILLLIAEKEFGAPIDKVFHRYETYFNRKKL